LDVEIPFPNSKEKLGRFVGIAENVGDALTFWIWTKDEKLSDRSVICSAEAPASPNEHVEVLSGDPPTTKQVISTQNLLPNGTLPIIDPDQLVEYADGNEDHLPVE